MDFNFEEVKDNVTKSIKKITPLQWGLIAGGVGLGVFIFYPRQSSGTFVEPGIVRATSGGSTPAGLDGQPTGGGLVAGTDATLSKIVTDAKAGFDALQDENDTLKSSFNQISSEFSSYQTNTNKALQVADESFNSLKEDYSFEKALNDIPSIYFNSKADDVEFNQVFKSVGTSTKSKELSDSQASRVLSKVAGLGNDGVGYDPKGSAISEARLKTDTSYKESEIARANAVIQNREKAGLDTTNQKNYLQKITGL